MEQQVENNTGKTKYFQDLAITHLPEMRLLFRGGKLVKKDNWRNVAEHCLVQIAVADKLADLLSLSVNNTTSLIKVAAVHDWEKRLKIKPNDFTNEEKVQAQEFLNKVNPDQNLMNATGSDFLEKALVKNNSTFLERLQFYIDDIVMGSEVVEFEKRVSEVEMRRKDLNEDEQLTTVLGGRYWDKERELDTKVEQEIFERIPNEIQERIVKPNNIPNYLREQIEMEWR